MMKGRQQVRCQSLQLIIIFQKSKKSKKFTKSQLDAETKKKRRKAMREPGQHLKAQRKSVLLVSWLHRRSLLITKLSTESLSPSPK
jgi:hypothetical protein